MNIDTNTAQGWFNYIVYHLMYCCYIKKDDIKNSIVQMGKNALRIKARYALSKDEQYRLKTLYTTYYGGICPTFDATPPSDNECILSSNNWFPHFEGTDIAFETNKPMKIDWASVEQFRYHYR